MRVAQAGWEQNNLELVGRMLHETEAAPYHGFEWFYWQRQIHLAATTLHWGSNVISLCVSPDGKLLLFHNGGPNADLYTLPLAVAQNATRPTSFLGSPNFSESLGMFSPDGSWVAYRTTEGAQQEIFAAPFPGPGGKRQISVGGGTLPRWRNTWIRRRP
jgi:Tol biopolymer transport system component